MSSLYKMPTSTTSKIPLPKSSIASPNGSRGDSQDVSTPAQSRIPVMKGVKSPVHDLSFATPTSGLNKENISVDSSHNSRKSRIPDIRSKISPTKEIQDADGGYRSDHSNKSAGSANRIPVARLPTSPSRIPTTPSRIPTIPPSPSRIPLRSSVESLSAEELDWESKEYSGSPRHRGPTNAFMAGDELRGRSSSDTRSSSNSSSSSSPHKRGRDPEVPPSKMRRTSPDGESVSPSKTRRPSPSKIPIAGNYVKTSNSSSNEDFVTPRGPLRDPWSDRSSDRDLKSSFSVQSELFQTAQESEGVEEFCDLGGGEAMAECDVAGDFLSKEALPRKALHLELGSKIPAPKTRAPTAPNSAPIRTIPELNWSIAKDDQPPKNCFSQSPTRHSDNHFRGSQSTSQLPDPQGDGGCSPPTQRPAHSTSRLPFLPLKEGGSSGSSTDSDGSTGDKDRGRRKKNFEAFVMTGDRMINLAKTPANIDFQSKYYKQQAAQPPATPLSDRTARTLDPAFEPAEAAPSSNSLPASPIEGSSQNDSNLSNQRKPGVRRSLVRNSKSEDQLSYDELNAHDSDDEKLNSSCHTLLDTLLDSAHTSHTPTRPGQSTARHPATGHGPPHVSSESSSSRSTGSTVGSSTDQLLSSQPSDEATSPDFSTSSLISCSEHYNGESLLDNMSPQSPSSPDTPEWSLIANGESFHKDVPSTHSRKSSKKAQGECGHDSLITSKDNRVIITINQREGEESQLNGHSSPGTSSGTITPDQAYSELGDEGGLSSPHQSAPPHPCNSPPPLYSSPTLSSEEESDMDSLHSYHPPVKIVDIPSAHRLAKRLYNLEGFRKSDISRHLSKNNDFSRAVAEEYCKLFSFTDLTLDAALRKFLLQFCLTGETQDRERVLLHFSKRFLECNPSLRGDTFQSHDSVHTLTCAIMLLNTDLHNEALQQRKMSPEEFVENLAELNDGHNFPEELLRDVYAAIKTDPIEWVQDDSAESDIGSGGAARPVSPPVQAGAGQDNPAGAVSFSNQIGGINPFLSMPDPDSCVDYKRGYVMRKSCYDSNNKKTKLGKRSWKMFYLTLRDLVLFCFKDEKTAQNPASFESPHAAVRIHHSVATAAADYTKKQFVFRLKTCDRAEYLFQTSDQKELETWVETINTVVGRYSSPPLPAPCSNTIKFQRPLFPSSRSKHSLSDQLANHRTQARELSQELADHTDNPPGKGAKSVIWSNFREKSEFVELEVGRYSTYISVLENLISKQQSNQMVSSPLKVITS
eukprot:GFUD01013516.1.p1 GENE.GFUD01013516.1~~GFUD01013516.1.p1  ORF type:complete len:1256 (-),score=334.06 GFUD01013516.1:289-4056(-)